MNLVSMAFTLHSATIKIVPMNRIQFAQETFTLHSATIKMDINEYI